MLHPIMSALHEPANLNRALRQGAEGATGDCPETRPGSSLLHFIHCRKIPVKAVDTPALLLAGSKI